MKPKHILITGVSSILLIILVSHAVRRHAAEQQQWKERQLRSQLTSMRAALKGYEAKRHEKAHTLHDLVRAGELKEIPVDPITNSASTWRTTVEETVRVDDFNAAAPAASAPSIIDVRSGAPGLDSGGRPWPDY